MCKSNYKTVAVALLAAICLAIVGEWWGFSAMVAVALVETYREYKAKVYCALCCFELTEKVYSERNDK